MDLQFGLMKKVSGRWDVQLAECVESISGRTIMWFQFVRYLQKILNECFRFQSRAMESRRRLQPTGYSRVVAHYSIEAMVQQIARQYEEILGRRGLGLALGASPAAGDR